VPLKQEPRGQEGKEDGNVTMRGRIRTYAPAREKLIPNGLQERKKHNKYEGGMERVRAELGIRLGRKEEVQNVSDKPFPA